ncbi:unnamed protein product [Eretmochelys imbricata]
MRIELKWGDIMRQCLAAICSLEKEEASLQILLRPVYPADLSPAPKLLREYWYTVYLLGEQVNLTCSAPGHEEVSGYRFFYHKGQQDSSIVLNPNAGARLEFTAEKENAGSYSCAYWRLESNQEISSRNSSSVSITVTDPPPPPTLSLHPLHPIYILGESVMLRCSAPFGEEVKRYRFFNQRGERISKGDFSQGTWLITTTYAADSKAYTCLYWRLEHGRQIPSKMSLPVPVPVMDTLPQPVLSMYPLSGAVSEGLPLFITCMAPRDAGKRMFHFYNNGAKIFPGDVGSEVNTTESRTCSMNISVLSILWSGPNNTGEFTCEYEENVSGRWILSPRSWAMNVTVSAHSFLWVQELVVGGSFFLINGLIFLVSHCCF